MAPRLSVVIPTLEEAPIIAATLNALGPARSRGVEVVVVDGGSRDATVELAVPLADRVIVGPRGRAAQMNAGARAAAGGNLLFLHADSRLPDRFDTRLAAALDPAGSTWGRFDVLIEGRHPGLCVIAAAMNLRSRVTGIATGDQGIFVTRHLFDALGGFPDQALMEDIEFSRRARRVARPICLSERIATSGRRWERQGLLRTILRMWRLRLAYFAGADPATLRRRYDDVR